MAVRIKQVHELTANLLIKLVVGKVQTQQSGVLSESLNHVFNTLVLLSFVTEIVRLQVKIAESSILAKCKSERLGCHETEAVTFELKLAKRLVCQESTGQILTFLVLNVLSAQVKSQQSVVVGDNLCENLSPWSTKLETGKRVRGSRLIILSFSKEDEHATIKSLALLLLFLLLLGILEGCLISLLFLFHGLLALLLAITLFFVVSLFQLYKTMVRKRSTI